MDLDLALAGSIGVGLPLTGGGRGGGLAVTGGTALKDLDLAIAGSIGGGLPLAGTGGEVLGDLDLALAGSIGWGGMGGTWEKWGKEMGMSGGDQQSKPGYPLLILLRISSLHRSLRQLAGGGTQTCISSLSLVTIMRSNCDSAQKENRA